MCQHMFRKDKKLVTVVASGHSTNLGERSQKDLYQHMANSHLYRQTCTF